MQNSVITTHNPNNKAITKAVIWLHGLGADGHDFEPIVPALGLSDDLAVRFIFPHAPKMPVTINGGYVMSSWYDILQMGDLLRQVDVGHIELAKNRILTIIDDQLAEGLALSDIVLAGFSQGGAVAYHTALRLKGLGGLLALSTYFATADEFLHQPPSASLNMPIAIHHGSYDDVVSPNFAQRACDVLSTMGFKPQVTMYPSSHQVYPKQVLDIGNWLNAIFIKNQFS